METSREEMVARLAGAIAAIERSHPTRVAIDGPDAAGKSTLADELERELRARGRDVIRASIDGFHRRGAERYRRGADSPRGYFEDSFDVAALRDVLLDPLGPGGDLRHVRAIFDFRRDEPLDRAVEVASSDAVLIVDGVFLLRRELHASWDLRVFVSAGLDETLRRALERDAALFGSRAEIERRYRARYIPGQRLYFARCRPEEAADLVVVNDDPSRPVLVDRRTHSDR
jgi:uridine kinase